jgi:hypothetical protein
MDWRAWQGSAETLGLLKHLRRLGYGLPSKSRRESGMKNIVVHRAIKLRP